MADYAVLFVCTGNICRSPTAEGVFRHRIRTLGLEHAIHVDSAGTHGYHVGDPPDPRTVRAALSRGIRLDDLCARRIREQDFHDFDLILAMDSVHMQIMRSLAPHEARARLEMFLSFAPQAGIIDVPDPYYGGPEGFEKVLDLVHQGVEGILAHIRQEREMPRT